MVSYSLSLNTGDVSIAWTPLSCPFPMEWVGLPGIVGGHTTQLILLTASIFGLQFAWGIEQAYVNVFLLELGIAKSNLAFVWLIGLLCGLLVQPVVGVVSDQCTSRYGRRRPFMIWGAIFIGFSLLTFAYCREISTWKFIHMSPLFIAIFALVILDITVNLCQACCRSLIVDVLPEKRQNEANSWAGRQSVVGHLMSYGLCSMDIEAFGFDSQLKGVCWISSVVLIVAVSISATAVKERILISSGSISVSSRLRSLVYEISSTITNLDRVLSAIFKVQLCAWYSWCTFLFYGSTLAAEVWRSSTGHLNDSKGMMRAGSLALVVFSLSATTFSVILPLLRYNLITLWIVSFIVFAAAEFLVGFINSYDRVLLIFSLLGLPWAMTVWAPFALTAERIHQLPPQEVNPDFTDQESVESQLTFQTSSTERELPENCNELAGVYMGIHNCSITLPQFISTFGSYIIFRVLEADPHDPHADNGRSIAVALQIGSIASLLAASYASKVRKLCVN